MEEIIELRSGVGKNQLFEVLLEAERPCKVVIGGIKILDYILKADMWIHVQQDGSVQIAALLPEWLIHHTYIIWEGWLRDILDYLEEDAHSRAEKLGHICVRTFMEKQEHTRTGSANEMLHRIDWGRNMWGQPLTNE